MSDQYYFGRLPDAPDPRDYKFSLPSPQELTALPLKVDLRDNGFLPPVYDQGNLGSCVANASCAALEYSERRLGELDVMRSRLELYYYARQLEGTVNEDSGCTIRDAFKALNKFGSGPEANWPYDISKYTMQPDQSVTALDQKLIEYRRIADSYAQAGVRYALNQGLPVCFGISVYSSFMSEQAQSTGVIPKPNTRKETLLGGHAILAVGYDDTTRLLTCRNSWGSGWGEKGYFYLPYAYAFSKRLAGDYWVVNKY